MSQIFYLRPSFSFIKSRKLSLKKRPKVSCFFLHKTRTKAQIQKMRHASLKGNLVSICLKFDERETNIKRDINVQKIKVKKTHLN